MRIEHTGLLVRDLEQMKSFYVTYFDGECSDLYVNRLTRFSSYFISFENGARLELMHYEDTAVQDTDFPVFGYHHVAFVFATWKQIDQLTVKIKTLGYEVLKDPRVTGLGDYVSTIKDPEGNLLELLVLKGG